MKIMTAIFSLLFVSSAFASSGELSTEGIAFLEAASHCAPMLQHLSSKGIIVSGSKDEKNDLDIFRINFMTPGDAPNFESTDAGSLIIKRTFEPSFGQASGALGGGQLVYACSIIGK